MDIFGPYGHIRTIFGHIRAYSDHIRTYSGIFGPYSDTFGHILVPSWPRASVLFENKILGFCTLLFQAVPDHIRTIFRRDSDLFSSQVGREHQFYLKTKFSDFAPYFLRAFRTIFGLLSLSHLLFFRFTFAGGSRPDRAGEPSARSWGNPARPARSTHL